MSYYQTIYNVLRAGGLTQAGALGFLGNWDCESNCEPFRLQGDFSPYRSASHQYVADVTSGKIPMSQFAHDGKGFGLAQWTASDRKSDLYDFWKRSGKALDSAEMQCSFCWEELNTQGYLSTVRKTVTTSSDLYECVKIICIQYERPAVNNIDARFQSANRIKGEIDLDPQPVPPTPPTPNPQGDVYWPPRTIDKNCFDWPEVWVLQSILYCRGYGLVPVGDWLDDTTESLIAFQEKAFPGDKSKWDGCCGPLTWRKLLEMG